MKHVASITTAFLMLTACADAQKTETTTAGPEPILRAESRIELCVRRYENRHEQFANCAGAHARACMNSREDGETTVGMMQCSMEEASAWDERLNATYAALQAELDPGVFEALRDAQRAWIASRDADCALEISPYEGGSIQPVIAAGCELDLTAARALQLEEWQAELPPF